MTLNHKENQKTFLAEFCLAKEEESHQILFLSHKENSIKLELNLKSLEIKQLNYKLDLISLIKIKMNQSSTNETKRHLRNKEEFSIANILRAHFCESKELNLNNINNKNNHEDQNEDLNDNDFDSKDEVPLKLICKNLMAKFFRFLIFLLFRFINIFLPPVQSTKSEKILYFKK